MQTKSPDLNCPNGHVLTTLAKSLLAAGLTLIYVVLPVGSHPSPAKAFHGDRRNEE